MIFNLTIFFIIVAILSVWLLLRQYRNKKAIGAKFKYSTIDKKTTDDNIIVDSTWAHHNKVGDIIGNRYYEHLQRPISIDYNEIKENGGNFFIQFYADIYNGFVKGKAWAVISRDGSSCILAFPKNQINKISYCRYPRLDAKCVKFIVGDDDMEVLKTLISNLDPSIIEKYKHLIPIIDDNQEAKIRVDTNQEEDIDLFLEKAELEAERNANNSIKSNNQSKQWEKIIELRKKQKETEEEIARLENESYKRAVQ